MSTITNPTIIPTAPVAAPGQPAPAAPAIVQRPVLIDGEILIPAWVVDQDTYRSWAKSDEFPRRGRFSFIDGTIWVDLTMEEFFSHNQVKGAYSNTLGSLTGTLDNGYYGYDGNLWTNAAAGISTEPDGLFFTFDSLQSGRIRLIKGKEHGFVEIEGTPNMALEIVSDSSVKKDTQILKDKCALAGVDEYWLVDARGPQLLFEIWILSDGQYKASPSDHGWLSSTVFGHSFKLEQSTDRLGNPRFQLLVR